MKNKARSQKEKFKWYKTFWAIFNAYRETDYSTVRSINHDKPGKAQAGIGHVKPNRSDFVADVETAARSVLVPALLARFNEMRGMKKVPDSPANLLIAELCGAEFFRRGIHPLSEYFKDVYCVPTRRQHA